MAARRLAANEIMLEMGIDTYSGEIPHSDEQEQRLEEVVRVEIKKILNAKEMEKMHSWFTKECNQISQWVQRIAKWGYERPWDRRMIRMGIMHLLDLMDTLIADFCDRQRNELTF